MSSPLGNNEITSSTPSFVNVGNEQAPIDSGQIEDNTQGTEKDKDQDQVQEDLVIKRKRQKTSVVWNDFDEVEITGGAKKAICKYCKEKFATGGKGSSTSHLRRHANHCMQRRLQMATEKKQSVIPFQPASQVIHL